MAKIEILSGLSDNYIYLIDTGESAIVIDPGESAPVLQFLAAHPRTLTHILLTHHHSDHTGGSKELKAKSGCTILGPHDRRMRYVDTAVSDSETFSLNSLAVQIISVPGHTRSSLAFFFPDLNALFSGDTLFAAGCGRLFEGTPAEMYASLQKLAALDPSIQLHCGHEYTEENLRFAASLEPSNSAVAQRLQLVQQLRKQNKPTLPSSISEELITNPFLRCNDPGLKAAVGLADAADVAVFAEIRSRKDVF